VYNLLHAVEEIASVMLTNEQERNVHESFHDHRNGEHVMNENKDYAEKVAIIESGMADMMQAAIRKGSLMVEHNCDGNCHRCPKGFTENKNKDKEYPK
jgi:hypothetical protein